jgi:hypothetical protein
MLSLNTKTYLGYEMSCHTHRRSCSSTSSQRKQPCAPARPPRPGLGHGPATRKKAGYAGPGRPRQRGHGGVAPRDGRAGVEEVERREAVHFRLRCALPRHRERSLARAREGAQGRHRVPRTLARSQRLRSSGSWRHGAPRLHWSGWRAATSAPPTDRRVASCERA